MHTPIQSFLLTLFQLSAFAVVQVSVQTACLQAQERPNVILVITDDQGFGDIGVHGNSMIRTPHLDRLHDEAVSLTDFHVDPTCSPTRSALMTGRYSTRTGVWHTIMGRSLMRAEEQTVAEVLRANGYRTAMFGKWHLGDNFPCRPQDQGFDHVVWHRGGGVGQGPDYWDNDYFDDTYEVNGVWKKFDGYCTDVWFDQAISFVKETRKQTPECPFFVYLSTNAPHGPFHISESYSSPYEEDGVPPTMAKFYGMITNIDENIGRLRDFLQKEELAQDTIFIFMTDNGTAAGRQPNRKENGSWSGFNAGMRGQKGSEYDGGHRVPFFIHWPRGGVGNGHRISQISAHIDVLPTLMDLCEVQGPMPNPLDGVSLASILRDPTQSLPTRTLFVHSQRLEYPKKWRKSVVMTQKWRLVNAMELYEIAADPAQSNNVAETHPEVVHDLQARYHRWWRSLQSSFDDYVRIGIGGKENPVELMAHDWHTNNKGVPWHQNHVRKGILTNGFWAVTIHQSGQYEVILRRWPQSQRRAMNCVEARFTLDRFERKQSILPRNTEARFRVDLLSGQYELQTYLKRADGSEHGAYFVSVRRL